MILSVSRRTDIPAFYSDWFYNRIRAGFVDVRNPMNVRQISRVKITPDVVDCIVFWTKNPKNMITRLDELDDYKYYFQFTINPYDKQIENHVPFKSEIINTFKELSNKIGKNKIIWRYDPILLTEKINISYHTKYFEEIAKRLEGLTNRCVISFVDMYKKTVTNTKAIGMHDLSESQIYELAEHLKYIAENYGLTIMSCAENIDLGKFGIEHGSCIERKLIEEICSYKIDVKKDKNQREECGCVESIDIGAYNTCGHGCSYCYANFNLERVKSLSSNHNPKSSLITGELKEDDIIKERKVSLLKLRDKLLF